MEDKDISTPEEVKAIEEHKGAFGNKPVVVDKSVPGPKEPKKESE